MKLRKNLSIFEMIVVCIVIVLLIAFSSMFAIGFNMHKVPLALDIGYNFAEISFDCDASKDDWECYKLKICPLNFKWDEVFDGTIWRYWEFKNAGDVSKYNGIDLSKYVADWEDISNTTITWWADDGKTDTTKINIDKFVNAQWCKTKYMKWHQLNQFRFSMQKALNLWTNDNPKIYAINGLLYDKHFHQVNWAVDYNSDTFIANWIIYFN